MAKQSKYTHLFPDYKHWLTEVTINWQPLIKYAEQIQLTPEQQGYDFFYKIVAIRKGQPVRLLYIGKAVKQSTAKRLNQHSFKIQTLKESHKGYVIYVSVGILDEISRKTIKDEYIDEIESLLIYAHSDESEFKYIENKLNRYSHKVTRPYRIKNTGELSDKMYKTIIWDIFKEE